MSYPSTVRSVLKPKTRPVSFSLDVAYSLVALSDALILLGTGAIIYWYYVGLGIHNYEFYAFALIGPTALTIVAFYQTDLYNITSIFNPTRQIPKILGIQAITFLVFLALAFGLKISEVFSRVWVFSWFFSAFLIICLARSLWPLLLYEWTKAGKLSRKLVIVGSGEQAKKFIGELQRAKEPWLSIIGIFEDRQTRLDPSLKGVSILGNVDDLLIYARKNRVDDIVLALPWSAENRLIEISGKLKELPVHVRLGSDLAGYLALNSKYSLIGGVPMLDLANKPLDGWRYALKETEDKVLAFFILLILSPFMLLIALAIKIESNGPALFRQKRYGFNNQEFTVLKFRSMHHDRSPEKGVPQARRNDPRTTRVGAFLRRTSLDELPQLLNVLGGTMALVGPRPHAVEHNEEYSKIIDGYFSRHRVKPGITGWAQVNGLRGETDTLEKMQARVAHDVYYINNWSFFFDIRILIMTFFIAAFQKNAY